MAFEPRPGVPVRLLLVEDERSIRDMVGRVLLRQGYDVTTAPGGEEAVELVERGGLVVDLLITDLIMPVLNGAAVAARLRQAMPGLPVLFISGHTDHPLLEQARAMGDGFLGKPFSLGQLSAAISHAFGMPDAAADEAQASPSATEAA
jgi:two-component system cell cycle sensor histidine kinase/response regulator CckA